MNERNELKKEIEIPVFEEMIKKLENLPELGRKDFSVFIYGQGSQTRSFYRKLKFNPDIELFWTGWSGPKLLWFLSFIPGQAGLLKIIDPKKTKSIFTEVGALSFCGLYFIPKEKENELIEGVKKHGYRFDVKNILKESKEYFLLDIDFDYHAGARDGEVYFMILNYGEGLNKELKNTFIT